MKSTKITLRSPKDLLRYEAAILKALRKKPWTELFLVDPFRALEELGFAVDGNLRRELSSRFPETLRPDPDRYARIKSGEPLLGPRIRVRLRSLALEKARS